MDGPRDGARPLGLTRTQYLTLAAIQEMTGEGGVPPSLEDLRAELGYRARSAVHRVVASLERRGHLARQPGHARSLTVLRPVDLPEDLEFVLSPELARAAGQGGAP